MTTIERVTVTLPSELVTGIDRLEKNRSKFVAEAIRNELERRRQIALAVSLENPHPESMDTSLADAGLEDWMTRVPAEDVEGLLDPTAGTPVRWMEGAGWVEDSEAPALTLRKSKKK